MAGYSQIKTAIAGGLTSQTPDTPQVCCGGPGEMCPE